MRGLERMCEGHFDLCCFPNAHFPRNTDLCFPHADSLAQELLLLGQHRVGGLQLLHQCQLLIHLLLEGPVGRRQGCCNPTVQRRRMASMHAGTQSTCLRGFLARNCHAIVTQLASHSHQQLRLLLPPGSGAFMRKFARPTAPPFDLVHIGRSSIVVQGREMVVQEREGLIKIGVHWGMRQGYTERMKQRETPKRPTPGPLGVVTAPMAVLGT